jgi:hypothetical protein
MAVPRSSIGRGLLALPRLSSFEEDETRGSEMMEKQKQLAWLATYDTAGRGVSSSLLLRTLHNSYCDTACSRFMKDKCAKHNLSNYCASSVSRFYPYMVDWGSVNCTPSCILLVHNFSLLKLCPSRLKQFLNINYSG